MIFFCKEETCEKQICLRCHLQLNCRSRFPGFIITNRTLPQALELSDILRCFSFSSVTEKFQGKHFEKRKYTRALFIVLLKPFAMIDHKVLLKIYTKLLSLWGSWQM